MNKKLISIVLLIAVVAITAYFIWKKQSPSTTTDRVTIKIGVLAPLSGENATYGDATMRGLDMALAEISKNDEYKNFQLELVTEDSKLEAAKAVNGIQKLISVDKVPVIIGPFGSSEVLAASQSANDGKTPLVSASATADAIVTAGDYVFRIVPPNQEQGTSMANFIVNKLNIKDSIVIIALNNDYGISLSSSFKNRVVALGGKIVYVDKFDEKAKDFRTLIVKVKNHNPKFIYLPDHYNEAGLFLKQARELGLNCLVGGGDGSYSPDLISIGGKGAEDFYLTLMGMDNSNPKTKEFNDAYKSKYNQDVDVYSAYAYDALFVLADALKNLSSEKLRNISGDSFKTLLNKQTFVGITGNNRFDNNGEVKKSFVIYQVRNRKFEVVTY
jgi:branched-chain amino acid transport system substrate-binding protein